MKDNLTKSQNTTQSITMEVIQKVLSKNDKKALQMRELYAQDGLYVINLMSSAGSGKTTFLETLAESSTKSSDFGFAVIEGDLQTNRDADRLKAKSINAYQILTGEACHLDASMIEEAYHHLKSSNALEGVGYLFIENVGNLVCPASYNLGADINIVLLSTPEGDDKVLKYPTMFLCADALIISKADLIEHFGFDLERVKSDLAKLKKGIPIFLTSKNDIDSIQKVRTFIVECKMKGYHSKHKF